MNIINVSKKLFENSNNFTIEHVRSIIDVSGMNKDNKVFFGITFLSFIDIDKVNPDLYSKRLNLEWDRGLITFLDFRIDPYFEYEIIIDNLFDLDSVLETLSTGNSLQLDILDRVIFL